MNSKSLVVVWYRHSRRAETLAAELGAKISLQYEIGLKGRWLTLLRYLVQGWKTWRLLEQERPEIVMVQVPPIFALLVVAVWCELRGKDRRSGYHATYIVDCHTGAFFARWRWSVPLLRLLSRRTAVILVASEKALVIVQKWKIRCILLVDGIPTLRPTSSTVGTQGDVRVVVICGFDPAEPIAEIFAAAKVLPHVTFYLSGDPEPIAGRLLVQKPGNVILTDFLQDSDYIGLLKNVHGIVDLTNRPETLTCGAYEALAVGQPAVVSDWPQIKRYFNRGFIYVNNTPEAIVAGVEQMLNERAMLIPEIVAMRSELATRRQPGFEELTAILKL
jgi:glycosyltransferase involved in cell wall biosynthesis